MARYAPFLLAMTLAACATPSHMQTASGNPEVTIATTDRAAVKGAVINSFVSRGFTLDQEGDYSLQFSKPMEGAGGVMYQAMLGNSYSSTPRWNVNITLAPLTGETRVVGKAFVRMQNAFGKEDTNDMTSGKAGQQIMEMLQQVKKSLEPAVAP